MRTPRTGTLLLTPLLAALLASCAPTSDDARTDAATAASDAAATTALVTVSLDDAVALGVRNARMPVPGLLTGGQLDQAQFDGLSEAGFQTFISLRVASEDGAGWEEAHEAGTADFVRLPISGATGLTRESVEALDRLLTEVEGTPTVLYCGSGNRVGALLALRAHWMDDVPADEALELGRAAGLTRLEPAVAELLGTGMN